jgi:small conductance mechanosensitive channel
LWLAVGQAQIQQAKPEAQPTTTQDIEIPVEELKILVKPLTRKELEVEAAAWMKLLRAKAKQISAAQLAVKRTNQAMDAADGKDQNSAKEAIKDAAGLVKRTADEAAAEQKAAGVESEPAKLDDIAQKIDKEADTLSGEQVETVADKAKQALLDKVIALRSEQTALIDRLNVVLDSLEAKGGDVTAFRQYVSAVAGLNVDVSDASATWSAVTGWLLSDEGGLRWLWNIIKFVLVVFLTWALARLFGRLVLGLASRTSGRMSKLAQDAIARTLKTAVWIVGLVMALSMLEINVTPLLAAIGAAGLVIGLALQGTLSNIASGVMILLNRPFDVGDVVSAAGVTGKISEMSLVATIFRTFDNQTIVVPNNSIWGQVITNITANDTRRVDLTFSVGYSDDLDKAERIIMEVVQSHELVLEDPEPVVKVNELADSSVNIVCRAWARTSDYITVFWDVLRRVKDRFDAEGISIPFPQRDVHLSYPPQGPAGSDRDAGKRSPTATST